MIPELLEKQLGGAERILIAGAGGGYDIMGTVPLLGPLRRMGKTVTLASLTFTKARNLGVERCDGLETLSVSSFWATSSAASLIGAERARRRIRAAP
jgi:hypothetical protein